MMRAVSMEEISDGRLYGLDDMVKAGCDGCQGCSACCRGMGRSIVLDPLDVHRLCGGLGLAPAQLLEGYLELNVVDGIVLPNLKMSGEGEACVFLSEEGRCGIHPFRPGICRLFPLGRYYEDGSFSYFLQVHECRKGNRTKVKIRRWIDTPEPVRYGQFAAEWHYFLKWMEERCSGETARAISMYVLQQFYLTAFDGGQDFYLQFSKRLEVAKEQWEK